MLYLEIMVCCLLFTLGIVFPYVSSEEFIIGGLLSDSKLLPVFNKMVSAIGDEIYGETVRFKAISMVLENNALTVAKQTCLLINATNGRMFTVIVSHSDDERGTAPLSVSFTTSFYNIPTIGVDTRLSLFSDKHSHVSFLRTVPPYSKEALIWVDLITTFGWREVTIIHSDDHNAKALVSVLDRYSARTKDFRITRQLGINTDEEDAIQMNNFQKILKPIRNEQTRVVLLFLRRLFAEYVFRAAKFLGMLDEGWSWVVSEQVLGATNLPQGVLSVRLLQADVNDHLADAVRVASQAIISAARKYPTAMRILRGVSSCDDEPTKIMVNTTTPEGRGVQFPWLEYASKLYRSMVSMQFPDGQTGHIAFDSSGDRLTPVYEIVNAQESGRKVARTGKWLVKEMASSELLVPEVRLVPVGTYGIPQTAPEHMPADTGHSPLLLSVNISLIRWPGNSVVYRPQLVCVDPPAATVVSNSRHGRCAATEQRLLLAAPSSFKIKTHLKVVTAHSAPFVQWRPQLPGQACNESDDPLVPNREVQCTHTSPKSGLTTTHCCFGYCVDLLRRLANRTGFESGQPTAFTYDLHLVGDGQIGEEVIENGTHRWTGLVGEVLAGDADLVVAPLTVTPERANRVEFSKPFKYVGITILIKREKSRSNLGSFLQPFENTLWVLVALSVHAVAWILYLLDRFSPFGRRSSSSSSPVLPEAPTDNHVTDRARSMDSSVRQIVNICPTPTVSDPENPEGLDFSSAVYFAWGILLNSGIGESTPKSFSARFFGMVWAGFAMIIVASYTANLAAFLVLDRPESSISGINDMRLRNPQKDFSFGTIRGSPVEMYFKRQVEYSTLCRMMDAHNYGSVEEAIEAVKNGKLKAFIWDSARLEYEAARDCELVTAGEVFGRTGYALAMKKDDPWLYELSQAVLNFHERGVMEEMDRRWIQVEAENCHRTESSPATLGLTNMAGVFIMIFCGILIGFLLVLVEVLCHRRRAVERHKAYITHQTIQKWKDSVKLHKLSGRHSSGSTSIASPSEKEMEPTSLATAFKRRRMGSSANLTMMVEF